ncbi:MAG TPA: Hsp20/alpha crystallin family protein [Flavisolibacter sp.]|jgi:HSP20 family protein|nr:Hsp20/alpha crystallin family protein [Flavisolibacter sp.]
MANIMKRNNGNNMPVRSFGGLVDGVLQNTLSRFFDDDFWGFDGMLTSSHVPVNIRENDKSYEMEIVAPGLRKEDFSVNISDKLLTVSFEHKDENREEGRNDYLRQEYRRQAFRRSFTLDDTVDAEKIVAEYRDGILHVNLPKKEGAQRITKTVKVK